MTVNSCYAEVVVVPGHMHAQCKALSFVCFRSLYVQGPPFWCLNDALFTPSFGSILVMCKGADFISLSKLLVCINSVAYKSASRRGRLFQNTSSFGLDVAPPLCVAERDWSQWYTLQVLAYQLVCSNLSPSVGLLDQVSTCPRSLSAYTSWLATKAWSL